MNVMFFIGTLAFLCVILRLVAYREMGLRKSNNSKSILVMEEISIY